MWSQILDQVPGRRKVQRGRAYMRREGKAAIVTGAELVIDGGFIAQ
jgi:hypothetical protein